MLVYKLWSGMTQVDKWALRLIEKLQNWSLFDTQVNKFRKVLKSWLPGYDAWNHWSYSDSLRFNPCQLVKLYGLDDKPWYYLSTWYVFKEIWLTTRSASSLSGSTATSQCEKLWSLQLLQTISVSASTCVKCGATQRDGWVLAAAIGFPI